MKFLTLSLLTSSASISLTLSLPSPSLRSTSSHSIQSSLSLSLSLSLYQSKCDPKTKRDSPNPVGPGLAHRGQWPKWAKPQSGFAASLASTKRQTHTPKLPQLPNLPKKNEDGASLSHTEKKTTTTKPNTTTTKQQQKQKPPRTERCRPQSTRRMPTSTPSPWLLLLPRRQRRRLLRPTRRPRWSDSPAAAGAPPTPPWLTLAEASMKSGLHSRFKPLFEAAWLVIQAAFQRVSKLFSALVSS